MTMGQPIKLTCKAVVCKEIEGVCIAQIGLVDVLREEYGITPGGVLGHSAGEIACGYGDGCFTREQTVLVAYHRGRMCPEHGISGGLMAAVGLGADEAEARLVKHGKASCVVGCDNSPTSTTLSGVHSLPVVGVIGVFQLSRAKGAHGRPRCLMSLHCGESLFRGCSP